MEKTSIKALLKRKEKQAGERLLSAAVTVLFLFFCRIGKEKTKSHRNNSGTAGPLEQLIQKRAFRKEMKKRGIGPNSTV